MCIRDRDYAKNELKKLETEDYVIESEKNEEYQLTLKEFQNKCKQPEEKLL